MQKMKSLLAMTAIAGLLSAASSVAFAAEKQINIAAVLLNMQDPFWSSVACGVKTKASELGVKLNLFTSTTMDAAPLTANFNAALLTNPDGLIANPANANQFVTQYGELMAAGKPVVTSFGTEPPAQYKVFWATGETEPYLEETLKLIPNEAGKMVVLGGLQGLTPLEIRYLPFVDALKKSRPDLVELERVYSVFDINKATSAVSALLIAHPDLNLVVASNGPDGVAAAAAVKAAGKAGQVTVIAFDAVPPEVSALKEGVITALIAQSPIQMGAGQVAVLVDYIKAGHTGPVPVSAAMEGIPQRLLTKDNVDDPKNADYIYKGDC